MIRAQARFPGYLIVLLAIYCAASLVHFVHNAEFVADYPNLPIWLTRPKIYLAWVAVSAVGAVGVCLLWLRLRLLGLLAIAGYAALGFAGLDHYWVAPVSAHSLGMNITIWFEVAAATLLLCATLTRLFRLGQQFASTHA